METSNNFDSLKKEISDSASEHSKYGGWNGTIFNGTTMLAIAITSMDALLPVDVFYLKILSGFAAMLIAVDRALNWGARWIFHRQMKQEYLIILTKIAFYENIPANFTEEEQKANYKEICTDLYNTRRKEADMPGVNPK